MIIFYLRVVSLVFVLLAMSVGHAQKPVTYSFRGDPSNAATIASGVGQTTGAFGRDRFVTAYVGGVDGEPTLGNNFDKVNQTLQVMPGDHIFHARTFDGTTSQYAAIYRAGLAAGKAYEAVVEFGEKPSTRYFSIREVNTKSPIAPRMRMDVLQFSLNIPSVMPLEKIPAAPSLYEYVGDPKLAARIFATKVLTRKNFVGHPAQAYATLVGVDQKLVNSADARTIEVSKIVVPVTVQSGRRTLAIRYVDTLVKSLELILEIDLIAGVDYEVIAVENSGRLDMTLWIQEKETKKVVSEKSKGKIINDPEGVTWMNGFFLVD